MEKITIKRFLLVVIFVFLVSIIGTSVFAEDGLQEAERSALGWLLEGIDSNCPPATYTTSDPLQVISITQN